MRFALALKYIPHVIRTIFFVRCISKVSRVYVVLHAESVFSTHLKFYRTRAKKSTFRTQNDTDKANFRCTADKNHFLGFLKLFFRAWENVTVKFGDLWRSFQRRMLRFIYVGVKTLTHSHSSSKTSFKAMDQPGHVTRFLLYRHFSLCNPISIKNKIGD